MDSSDAEKDEDFQDMIEAAASFLSALSISLIWTGTAMSISESSLESMLWFKSLCA